MEEKLEIFPCSAFHFLVFDEYQSALISRKLLCTGKFLVTRLYLNDLSVDCSREESIYRFLGRTLYKNHENAKCPNFSFIILNLEKKSILDPSCYYSLWHIYERRNWKLPSQSTLKENFGTNESINFNYHSNKLVNYRSFFFVLSYLQDSLQYKQSLVPFIDSSSRLEKKYIKNFTEWTGKNLSRSHFFHKDLMIGALLKLRHSNTGVFLWIFWTF